MANTGQFDLCCNGPLNVSLHRPGLIGMFRRPVPARCLHFSPKGLQIETGARFQAGERLVLDLRVNDLLVEELNGTIRSVSAAEDRCYYDIEFELDRRRALNTVHCLRHLSMHVNAPPVAADRTPGSAPAREPGTAIRPAAPV
jgi:hypothetical protein